MKIGFALALALASAIALNWGYVAQHGAASTLPPLSLRRPIASLRTLFGHRRWLVGFIVGIAGWVLYVAALRLAPLSLVQATSAGGRLLFVPALLAAHGLAFACLQLGFQRGRALNTIGPATLLTNSLPIAAGIVLFAEPAGPLRVAAFVLVVAGAVLLARTQTGAGSGSAGIDASSRGMRRRRGGMKRSSASAPNAETTHTAAAAGQSANGSDARMKPPRAGPTVPARPHEREWTAK